MKEAFALPAAAMERHIGILGKTGSGKSNTAKGFVEGIMAAGGRACVLDPTGTWWGMRLAPDGKRKSKFEPVIFGGNHADIAISGEHGAAVGEAIATSSSSSIIDTRLMTVGQRTRFFTAFAEALMQHNLGTLHLVIDEAHLFAPQGRVNDPQSGAMLHAANNLVSLGRGLGLRIMLISQRPAKLHKDSLTQVETLIAMRLIAPHDRHAIEEWIGEWADPGKGKEITASLPSLPTGTGWVWSPEVDLLDKVEFPLASTFDSGKPLSNGEAAPTLTPIDIEEVGGKLDTIRQEAQANDPARLRREIGDLQRKLAAAPAVPDPKTIEEAEQRGFEEGRAQGLLVATRLLRRLEAAVAEALSDPSFEKSALSPPRQPAPTEAKAAAPARPVPAVPTPIRSGPIDATVTPAKRRILAALRGLEATGQTAPDKQIVAWFADASPKSSAYANNLGALRASGLIEYPGQGTVTLTDAGREAEPARAAPTHDHIMALVGGKLTPALRRMLDVAVAAYPSAVSIMDLAAQAGASPSSSAFANNRGRLRSLGLIDYPSNGYVRAAALLFPGGAA